VRGDHRWWQAVAVMKVQDQNLTPRENHRILWAERWETRGVSLLLLQSGGATRDSTPNGLPDASNVRTRPG
jgi:hypothetical protein